MGELEANELGKYKLLAVIGRGGMGEVYLAMARGPAGFRKLVVLKCMHGTSADDEQLRRMFLDEAALAARLSHQNVVQTYETGELDGALYIAMEYLDGQPVSRIMQAVPNMKPRLAAQIVADALAGVHYAHQLKDFDGTPLAIVHRDLSPPNIFVTYDGVVKIVDFGIAKTALASRTKTEADVFKGKVSYMAPEQALREDIDHRADIFSLGAVLWELVAGRRLFRETSPALTLKRLLQDNIPAPSTVRPDIDRALEAVIMRALQRDPDARYASAHDMLEELESYIRSGARINWRAELAGLVSEQFAAQRRKVQRQVQLCMSQDTVTFRSLPKMTLSGSSASVDLSVSGAMQRARSARREVDSSAGRAEVEVSGSPPGAREPRRGRTGVVLGGVAVALSLAAAVALFMVGGETMPEQEIVRAESVISGALDISSQPAGAMVFVDGEPSGLATPTVLKGLKAGETITVRLDKAGYQAAEKQVVIPEGQTVTLSFRLVESQGWIRFVGGPVKARVYVDDAVVAEDTGQLIEVPVGSHRIRVETHEALVFSQIVKVGPGEQTIQVGSRGSEP